MFLCGFFPMFNKHGLKPPLLIMSLNEWYVRFLVFIFIFILYISDLYVKLWEIFVLVPIKIDFCYEKYDYLCSIHMIFAYRSIHAFTWKNLWIIFVAFLKDRPVIAITGLFNILPIICFKPNFEEIFFIFNYFGF